MPYSVPAQDCAAEMNDTRDIRHNNPKIMRLNTTESDN